MSKSDTKTPTIPVEFRQDARDQLSFAEFPMGAIAHRVPASRRTLTFRDVFWIDRQAVEREVTISATERYSLPTVVDDEIVLAMMQLTKRANGFTSPVVEFSLGELCRILGWNDSGKNRSEER